MLLGGGLLLLLMAPDAGVAMRGSSSCPTPAEVGSRVSALTADQGEGMQAVVNSTPTGVSVELFDASGTLLAQKHLLAEGCEVLADASAVFLATWIRQVRAQELSKATEPEASGSWRRWWAVGAAALGGAPAGRWGLGGSVEAALGLSQHWGVGLTVVVPPQGVLPLELGSVAFRQPGARLGVLWQARWRRLVVDLRAEGVAGLWLLEGRGFDENKSVSGFAPGLGGSARVGLTLGPLRPFLAAMGTWWPIAETASVGGASDLRRLPPAQFLLALGLVWGPQLDAERSTGELEVLVRGEHKSLSGASVIVTSGSARRELLAGVDGRVSMTQLEPGELLISASLDGYLPGRSRVRLGAGDKLAVELVLAQEKPKVGGLSIEVVSSEGAALAAEVEFDDKRTPTSPEGLLALEGLAPGPLALKVTTPGFAPSEEAASIVAGAMSELKVTLVPEKQAVPATLKGRVHSGRGGQPVVAQLEIVELKQTLTANHSGAFSVQLPAGTYTVRITGPHFVTQSRTIGLREGDQAILNVDLAPLGKDVR